MGKFIKFMLPLILISTSVLVVMGLVAYQQSKDAERKPETGKAVLVDTIEAEVTSLNFSVNSQGTVRPRTETTLVSEVSGKIVSVAPDFVAGGFFRKGEVLLQIDPSDYQAGLKRAEGPKILSSGKKRTRVPRRLLTGPTRASGPWGRPRE